MGIWFFLNGKLCASVRQHGLRRIPKKSISCACGGIGNVHFVHSTQLRCVAVRFAMRIACGSSGKKATFTSFTPHSFAVLLSVLPCESPAALRVKRQRSLRSLQRQSRCCRICRADRLTALWTNPQPRSVSANMDSGAYLKNQYYAPVVELADTLDLGSSARAWGFKSLQAHQSKRPQGLFFVYDKGAP